MGYTSSRCSPSSSGQIWPGDILHSRLGCDSAPCLGMGKGGSRAGKTPCLRIQIRQICTLPSPLVRVYLVLQISKAACWNYYLGTTSMNSICQDTCTGYCKLLPLSPSQSDSQGLSPTDSPAIPMGYDHCRDTHKLSTMLR